MGVTADDTSFFTSTTKADVSTAFSTTKTRPVTDATPDYNKATSRETDKKKPPKQKQYTETPQASKSKQTLKFKIRFDSHQMLFDDQYPPELQPVLPEVEWEGLLRHLNTDLNQHIQQSSADLYSWTTGMLASSVAVVGVFVVPVVWWKKHRHQQHMEEFWRQVRQYFSDINKKTFIRRGLEWKVVEERKRQEKRDCYNPVYMLRVELLWRQNVVKSRKELARVGRRDDEPVGTSTDPPVKLAAATAAAPSSSKAKAKEKRKSASRPPSNIGSVKEVSPEREAALMEPTDPKEPTNIIEPTSGDAIEENNVNDPIADADVADNKEGNDMAAEKTGLFLSDSE